MPTRNRQDDIYRGRKKRRLPWGPEATLGAFDFTGLKGMMQGSARSDTFEPGALDRYAEAWAHPGSLTAMLNYYRALREREAGGEPARISPLTLLIWGEKDSFLEHHVAWETHERWEQALSRHELRRLLRGRNFVEAAARAVRVEQRSRHSMIFSFEKMALRDAVKSEEGARAFAEGLYEFLYGSNNVERRFTEWVEVVAALPRKQTRVLTWPLVTVFGFIAQPETHIFLKPNVTRAAAREYGFELRYHSRPSWEVYASLLDFAATVRRDQGDLRPRDMIDVQSFMWVQGSDEYQEGGRT